MAYYNPENIDGYYDPYANTEAQKPNALGAIGQVAKTMVIMGGLNMLGGAATKWMSGAATKMIQSGKVFKTTSRIFSAATQPGVSTLGDMFKQTGPVKKAMDVYRKSAIGQAGTARKAYLANIKSQKPLNYSLERFTSAFKNKETMVATAAGVWARTAAQGAVVAYGVDTALGITKDLGLEKKSWYDVPGHVKNFGKWFAFESISAPIMGGLLGPIAGGIKSAGIHATRKAFGGNFGKAIIRNMQSISPTRLQEFEGMPKNFYNESILNKTGADEHSKTFLKKQVEGLRGFGRTVGESYKQINTAFGALGQSLREGFKYKGTIKQKIGKATGPIEAAIRNVKEVQRNMRSDSVRPTISQPGIRAAQMLDVLSHKVETGKYIKEEQSLRGIIDNFSNEFGRLQKKTPVELAFKHLEAVKVGDVVNRDWVGEVSQRLKGQYRHSEVDELVKHVLNMRVGNSYKGHGANIKGGGVDLTAFDPMFVARRAAAKLFEKQIAVPLTKIRFNLGDITGWTEALAEEPKFEFFNHRPHFSAGIASSKVGEGKGLFSVGDFAQGEDPIFMYMNGKWGIFDEKGPRVIDTARKLKYAHRSGFNKKNEMLGINIQRALDEGADINQLSEKYGHRRLGTNNKFLNFLDRTGIGLPGKAEELLTKITDKLHGKNYKYREAATSIFGGDKLNFDYITEALPNLENILTHTAQPYSRILRNKEALQMIARYTHSSKLEKDIFDTMWDNQSLLKKVENLGLTSDTWKHKYNKGLKEAVEYAKAYPKQAETHIITKRLGDLSEMTSYDEMRVSYIDDVFNKWFLNEGAGNGKAHPLIAAVPDLVQKGVITSKEGKALSLHAKLSTFRDMGIFNNTGNPKLDPILEQTLNIARKHSWNKNNALERDIINFVSNNDMRSARISKMQDDILTGKEGGAFKFIRADFTPYATYGKGMRGVKDYINRPLSTFTRILDEISPIKYDRIKHFGLKGNLNYLAKNMFVVGGVAAAYRVTDTMIAANPLFDDTSLDQGITGLAADTLAKARLSAQRFSDFVGITPAIQHLEGLMPKSTSTLPGMIVGAALNYSVGGGVLGTFGGAIKGGLINRILNPYLPNFGKSYEELKEEYAGRREVPMMKSPTWLLGGTPWEGTKVAGYQPNWYVRAKTRWEETDTKYWSAFRRLIHAPIPLLGFNLGDIVDPYFLERKHYFSRPYPKTGELFEETPLAGPLLSSTIGRIIKPQKTMHQEFLVGEWAQEGDGPFKNPPPSLKEGLGMMKTSMGVRRASGRENLMGTFTYSDSKMWSQTAASRFLENSMQMAGLQGYLLKTAKGKVLGEPTVIPTLETAGRIASMSRSFYDMNLGGMGIITEPIRRLMTKPEYKRYGINPIPNMMPNWLPQQFLQGDPYTKIMKGELRLPGEAYNRTHTDVEKTMPGRASMIGGNIEHIIQYFTGLLPPVLKEEYDILEKETEMHALVQQHLAAEGLLVQAEKLVYDVKRDISGHVDAIIQDGSGGRGRRALEIKTISQEGFNKLDGPKDQHVGQLNFYLDQLRMRQGDIMYIVRDNPAQVKTFTINFSKSRLERDIAKLSKARQIAADMMEEKDFGNESGFSYSWLDRLKILADVAPASKEFNEAKYMVEEQMKYGKLTQKQISKYELALKHRKSRLRKYELYPLRFKGKVLSPDTEANIQSENENSRAASEYTLPERIIGSMWETFTNTNFFLINKFFAVKDPLEHYKMNQLYGKEYKPWDEPWRAWIEPYSRGLTSKTDPATGALAWGTGGFVLGGGFGSAIGAMAGSAWGSVHGLFRGITNTTYIPQIVQEQRDINRYFDAAKYERADRLSKLSSGLMSQKFIEERDATVKAFISSGGRNAANLFRSVPYQEKPYLSSFLNVKNEAERREILKFVPQDLGQALRQYWGKGDSKIATSEFDARNSMQNREFNFDKSLLDPSILLDDIKLKTVEEAGYDAHEFGLGWNEQQMRMQNSYNDIVAVKNSQLSGGAPLESDINSNQVRFTINQFLLNEGLKGRVNLYINTNAGDMNTVNITIRRNRSLTILSSLNNRGRYAR